MTLHLDWTDEDYEQHGIAASKCGQCGATIVYVLGGHGYEWTHVYDHEAKP